MYNINMELILLKTSIYFIILFCILLFSDFVVLSSSIFWLFFWFSLFFKFLLFSDCYPDYFVLSSDFAVFWLLFWFCCFLIFILIMLFCIVLFSNQSSDFCCSLIFCFFYVFVVLLFFMCILLIFVLAILLVSE
jgi:hypothetical protein